MKNTFTITFTFTVREWDESEHNSSKETHADMTELQSEIISEVKNFAEERLLNNTQIVKIEHISRIFTLNK